MFRSGRTFGLYLSHLVEETIPLLQPTDWRAPEIRSVSRGLASAQRLSLRFQNYMCASDLLRLIRHVEMSAPLGIAAFLVFLFLLRAPSEALPIRRAADSDLRKAFCHQPHKVLAGIRPAAWSGILLAKFPRRENIRRGCILRRPCLFSEASDLARLLSPAHMIRP